MDLYVYDPATRDREHPWGRVDTQARRQDLYAQMGAIAERRGWRWLGLRTIRNPETGKTFSDPFHLELREGRTWEQAMAEYAALRGAA